MKFVEEKAYIKSLIDQLNRDQLKELLDHLTFGEQRPSLNAFTNSIEKLVDEYH